jgi:Ca-activated chloride channel family protein
MFAARPLLIYGKWKGKPKGKISITGANVGGEYGDFINVTPNDVSPTNQALKYLWARNKIMALSDYNSLSNQGKFKDEITELGLKYNLLTQYTSFVGVDDQVEVKSAIKNSSSSGAVPEPHEWALIISSLILVGFLMFKRYVG